MKISVNITTFNRKYLTEFCINSLIKTTSREYFKLVVVDNFSTDGTIELLKKMKNEDIIDTLILNSENLHLGKAVNQAWEHIDKNIDWLLWINNDFFFMENWLDNLKLVTNDLDVDYVNCGYLEGIPRNKVCRGIPKKTKNGGSYLEPVFKQNKKYDVGACPVLKREIVEKYNIKILEKPFSKGYTGPAPVFYRDLYNNNLKGVRLDKPCILLQCPDYNNPLLKDYYNKTFGIRGIEHVLDFYRKKGHVKNINKYYEGTNYVEDFYHE